MAITPLTDFRLWLARRLVPKGWWVQPRPEWHLDPEEVKASAEKIRTALVEPIRDWRVPTYPREG